MEFTLTICQKQISENFPTLDIKDAGIIDFLGRFSHSCTRKVDLGKIYYWFDYGKISSECPLLRLESEAIRKRMRAMCSLGIFDAHPENRGGRIFFAFGDKYALTHRDSQEKEREQNPDRKKRTGTKSRPQREQNPVLGKKEREQNPDNHTNHSNHTNQPSVNQTAAAEILIKSTTEFEGVTMVEKVDAEERSYNSGMYAPTSTARRFDPFNIDTATMELKGNEFSAENFARITGTPAAQMVARFTAEVDAFVLEQKGRKTVYNRFDEFSGHFFNWSRSRVRARSIPGASAHQSQSPVPQNIRRL